MTEFWDVYDRSRQPTGKLHKRGLPLRGGEYHIVVNTVVLNTDGRLLIDRRSPFKRNCPNYWEFTSGSVVAGEDSRSGAARELKEELGIDVDPSVLKLLGSGRSRRKFVDTYLLVTDIGIDDLVLQQDEVTEAKLVTLDELESICKSTDNWCLTTLKCYRAEISEEIRLLSEYKNQR